MRTKTQHIPELTLKRERVNRGSDTEPGEKVSLVTKTPPDDGNWKADMDFTVLEINGWWSHLAEEVESRLKDKDAWRTELVSILRARLEVVKHFECHFEHETHSRDGRIDEIEGMIEMLEKETSAPVPKIVPKVVVEVRKSANPTDRYAPFYLRTVKNGVAISDKDTWYKKESEATHIANVIAGLLGDDLCVVKRMI